MGREDAEKLLAWALENGTPYRAELAMAETSLRTVWFIIIQETKCSIPRVCATQAGVALAMLFRPKAL